MITFISDTRKAFDSFEQWVGRQYERPPLFVRLLILALLSPLVFIYFFITRIVRAIYRIIRGIVIFVLKPFKVIQHHYLAFFLWLAFTIFGGLMGVIVNIMRNMWFITNPLKFEQALSLEMINGSFYTYSIAMVAGVLCSVLILFSELKKEELNFRGHQIVIVSFSIFITLFGGVFYALSKGDINTSANSLDSGLYIDWQQIIVFIIAVIISIYSFCVIRLNDHKEEFKELMYANAKEDQNDEALNNVDAKNFIKND